MRLFQILTRQVATGKIKVTQKLLHRLHRETDGKHHSKPHARKHHGFTGLFCVTLAVVLTLSICLARESIAIGPQPGQTASATYSAAALFNQANACARDGKPGVAILNYERAQLLAPTDADIAANLHFVRAKAGLPDASENWLTRSLTCVRPNTMAWLGSFGLVLAGMSILLVRLYPQRRLTLHSSTFAGALLAASAIANAIVMWPKANEAVVIVRDAPALTSPVLAAEPLFKLREGESRVGGEVGLKGTRPMTDSLPPLIEPNGRFSHIRLSEFGRVLALPLEPSVRVDEDWPRGGLSPCGAFGHRSLLISEQVSHLRSTPITEVSSLLWGTPTSPATPPAWLA